MDERTIVIERRFRGPDVGGGTGNGGYVCGLVALAAGPGARGVEIRRATGVPLDRPLVVRRRRGGAVLSDDEGLIARTSRGGSDGHGRPRRRALEIARQVSARFLERLESGKVVHRRSRSASCAATGGRRAMA